MHRRPLFLATSIALTACGSPPDEARDSTSVSAAVPTPNACTIDSLSIGGIRLGMSLQDASTVISGSRFERTSDGDGVALVAVKVDSVDLMTLHAGEDDPSASVDSTKTISFIETFNSLCSTATGIHPGMLLSEAEQVLGAVQKIIESEIESRQYITFDQQPSWVTLRIDYSGTFAPGSRVTTTYKPEGRIMSASIASR